MGGSAADVLLSRSGTRCGGQGEDEHRRREGRTGGLRAHCSDRMSSEVSLRPAVGEDREFLFELHKASMGPYVEELFGPWDDAVQWEFFDRWLHPTDTLVIKFGEHDVGVTRIEVHPDHQNRGIGTAVLRRVLADAATTGRTVSLHVFKVNPAHTLYGRLGFVTTTEDGDRVFMRAAPQQSRDDTPTESQLRP